MTNMNNSVSSEKESPAAPQPAAVPAAETPGIESELRKKLEETSDKAEEYRNAYLRAAADLENYRKRMAREMEELRTIAKAGLAEGLLPVLDNFMLGLESAQQHHPEAKAITDGFAIVLAQIRNVLEQHGVKELNPSGQPFDPKLHEAIAHQPHEKIDENKIISVQRLGYTLNGRLLRPAAVIVSSGLPAGEIESQKGQSPESKA